jgi:ABC-2 type transport system ATP-binding protein
MLKIQNLTFSYLKNGIPTIKAISLDVLDGEVFGFLGENGAGKSTIIKCICGQLKPLKGTISINGILSTTDPVLYKTLLGFVPDVPVAFEHLRASDYLYHLGRIYQVDPIKIKQQITKLIKMVGLEKDINSYISTYSLGMKQKLIMCSTLIHSPSLWLLDEPLTGMDLNVTNEILSYIKEYASEGHCILFSSHMIDIIDLICDKVAIIKHGRIVKIINMKELKKENKLLKDVYFESNV